MKSVILPSNILRRIAPKDRKAMGKAGMLPEEAEAVQVAKSEKELHTQILSMLMREGIHAFRARMDKKSTIAKGHPDIWFALGGRACAMEVKMPGKPLRPEQEQVISLMRQNGWKVAVVHSYAEARAALDQFAGVVN